MANPEKLGLLVPVMRQWVFLEQLFSSEFYCVLTEHDPSISGERIASLFLSGLSFFFLCRWCSTGHYEDILCIELQGLHIFIIFIAKSATKSLHKAVLCIKNGRQAQSSQQEPDSRSLQKVILVSTSPVEPTYNGS